MRWCGAAPVTSTSTTSPGRIGDWGYIPLAGVYFASAEVHESVVARATGVPLSLVILASAGR